jgi:WD40 repeat protein
MPLLRSLEDQVGSVWGLAFTPDGQELVVAANNFDRGQGSLGIYKVADGSKVDTLDAEFPTGVIFSPDGKTMAVNTNSTVLLWRVSDWTMQQTIAPSPVTSRTIAVAGFAFSPDGSSIATRSSTYPIGGQVDLWRVTDGKHIRTVVAQAGEGDHMVFTPDGQIIVTESNKQVQLWKVSDGTLLRTLSEATGTLGTSVAVSPDGETLATGSTILWKIADGSKVRDLAVRELVASMEFSPDGQMLATGMWSADDKARIWRVADGQLLLVGDAGGGTVVSVTFSPDGRTLATGSANGNVRLWRVGTE